MLLNEMEMFYYAIELQSFSKAAVQLSVSKSFISKHISKLEKSLNTRLIIRTTRKLVLTEAGEAFYKQCAKIVCEANESYNMLQNLQAKPSGTLKISAPPAFGVYVLAPLLPNFLQQYLDIKIDLQLDNRVINLKQEGYDIALRFAVLESSSLIAKKITTLKNVICAAPTYFDKHAIPSKPVDLLTHNFALYSDSEQAKYLTLHYKDKEEVVALQGNVITNHMDFIKQIVLSGECMTVLPEFMVKKELASGELVTCLAKYKLAPGTLYAMYLERKFMPLTLKVFLEMLKQNLQIL